MDKDSLIQIQAEPLLDLFHQVIPLNNNEKQLIISFFKARLYRKRQYVLQEGDTCNQFNFIVRGCLRMYKVDEKGSRHIIQFAAENGWMIDLGSFHSRKGSELNIDALEETLVMQISYEDLISLYK